MSKRSRRELCVFPPPTGLNINCLIPLEILAHICTFLGYTDVIAFVSTCKYIRRLLCGAYLTVLLTLRDTYPMPREINPRTIDLRIVGVPQNMDAFFAWHYSKIFRIQVSVPAELPHMPKLLVLSVIGKSICVVPKAPELIGVLAKNSSIADISNLRFCPGLMILYLAGTAVKDISAVRFCKSLDLLYCVLQSLDTSPPNGFAEATSAFAASTSFAFLPAFAIAAAAAAV
jgi:hypothetical protein